MGDLSEDFNYKEFTCNCGCDRVVVAPELIKQIQRLRTMHRKPIRINSGYRCPEYNARVGGVDGSAHTTGHAADIACETSEERHALLNLVFFYSLFTRVGIDKRFVHLDVDPSKPQHVVWIYT